MLVLSRKSRETILIGDDIKVVIVGSHHGKVRVGIEAPPHIKVLRGELKDGQGASDEQPRDQL